MGSPSLATPEELIANLEAVREAYPDVKPLQVDAGDHAGAHRTLRGPQLVEISVRH